MIVLLLMKIYLKNVETEDARSQLSKAEIVVADANLLIPYVEKLSETKWIQMTWAGLENFTSSIKGLNVPFVVTRFSGTSFGYAMSEYVVSQIVNFERDQRRQYENQTNCSWDDSGKIKNHRRLSDLTVGILGMGEIGSFSEYYLLLLHYFIRVRI